MKNIYFLFSSDFPARLNQHVSQFLNINSAFLGSPIERAEQLRAWFKSKKVAPEEAAKQINDELRERQRQPIAGGVSFDQRLTEMLGEVIAKGIERAAAKLSK